MRKGFTLIELLVVIAIIAVLAAILFPVFAKAREKARQSTCMSNQRQICVAVTMYASDHDETFPASASFWGALNLDQNILICPSLGKSVPNGFIANGNLCGNCMGNFNDASSELVTMDGTIDGTKTCPTNMAWTQGDMDRRHSTKAIASYLDGHVNTADKPVYDLTWNQITGNTNDYATLTPAYTTLGATLYGSTLTKAVSVAGNGTTFYDTAAVSTIAMQGDFTLQFDCPALTQFLIGVKSKPVTSGIMTNSATAMTQTADTDFYGVALTTTSQSANVYAGGLIGVGNPGYTNAATPITLSAAGNAIQRKGSVFSIYNGSGALLYQYAPPSFQRYSFYAVFSAATGALPIVGPPAVPGTMYGPPINGQANSNNYTGFSFSGFAKY